VSRPDKEPVRADRALRHELLELRDAPGAGEGAAVYLGQPLGMREGDGTDPDLGPAEPESGQPVHSRGRPALWGRASGAAR
jgi:hypothetical protein